MIRKCQALAFALFVDLLPLPPFSHNGFSYGISREMQDGAEHTQSSEFKSPWGNGCLRDSATHPKQRSADIFFLFLFEVILGKFFFKE